MYLYVLHIFTLYTLFFVGGVCQRFLFFLRFSLLLGLGHAQIMKLLI